ncbi:hypothetical protein Asppvi_011368 [Aspergillus pseudoviridinutans]|uniref:Mid2 domain-containing protein n=1 Tax=Aspergillus pseudoviridinutans TaxID=1517512 RepID=A0A9P3BJK2_9EURO|nr:uncharacterized protein Asppvi_011368 [Aspergillus pseudoviridinutans]GIJ92386.1 hypothetical protein Asppvi_011368 [Aspergillus pseudoviridinutans]
MPGVGPPVAATPTEATATTTSTTTVVTTTVPMVTVYTPPASCSSRWTYEASTYNGITSGILLQNAFSVDTGCFPPGFQQNGRILARQIFSPGACPDRYSTQQFVVSNAITTATCCLNDFSLYADSGYVGCVSTFTGATKVAARAGGIIFNTSDYTTSTSISGTYTMWGMPIVIENESTDRSVYTTAPSTSATTTASATATSSMISTSSSQIATQTAVSSSSGGLSSGAKAGIGVGVGVGVGALAIIGFLGFLLRRRRKAPAPSGFTPQHFREVQGQQVSELHADSRRSGFPITELPS